MTEYDPWSVVPDDVKNELTTIESARRFTKDNLEEIKKRLQPVLESYNDEYTVVIAGSYGRGEANPTTSDLDAFVLAKLRSEKQKLQCECILHELGKIANDLKIEMASKGAFSDYCCAGELLSVGAKNETSDLLTRRMLVLIEGVGISAENDDFAIAREQILDRYLQELQPSEDRRPIFLINDLIRYYRTICVEYEYKKTEAGKPWAVKLTKLRHSRKLIYFSTLLPLLESMNIDNKDRIDWLKKQFIDYTPMERIILILENHGLPEDWDTLLHYDEFLKFLSNDDLRKSLDAISFEGRKDDANYLYVRDNARRFGESLNTFVSRVDIWKKPISKYVLS